MRKNKQNKMNMKSKFLFLSLIFALMIGVSSCEKEAVYVAPTIGGIDFTPNPCEPGDTVLCRLNYAVAGDNWLWYSASFSVPTKILPGTMYKGSCENPSQCYFIAPENPGSYNIGFKGQVTIVCGKDLWGDAYTATGTLVVK